MPTDWDDRFSRGDELHGLLPSPPLPQAVAGVEPGLALDLACGAGRHALYLARQGWRVRAVDASRVGLQRMQDAARELGVSARIEAEMADLESPDVRLDGAWDLVCDFYFLHRPLFAQMRRLVRPGGLFVAALHVRKGDSGRFLLEPGELTALFAGWEILHTHEGESAESGHRHATAELIARPPALSHSE
ncbi:MAG TPA: methyltransferase domain-containing protein [Myxococcales bacterium]|jgi:tellurite methyltransferase|nr:methyltransferase domain-containing protein [Myxococcales bacterium]